MQQRLKVNTLDWKHVVMCNKDQYAYVDLLNSLKPLLSA